MPRIRTIKPEFWSDEKLSTLTAIDRLVFLGLIGMADDYGRIHDNIKVIDAFVFPNSSETVRESVANLSRIGRVRRGNASNGKAVIEIVNWAKHQRVDKPQNHLALPPISETPQNPNENGVPELVANHSGTIPEKVATLPGIRDQGSGTRDQGEGANEPPPVVGSPKRKTKAEPSGEWQVPTHLDTPLIRELLNRFARMRAQTKKPIKDLGNASVVLHQFETAGHLGRALEVCIANEYQGLKPEYGIARAGPSSQQPYTQKKKYPTTAEILGIKEE